MDVQIRSALVGVGLSLAVLVAAAAVVKSDSEDLRGFQIRPGIPAGQSASQLRPRPPSPASVQLSGSVIGMGTAASGVLTLHVGEQAFTTTVALPNYTVSVPTSAPDAMVSVEIRVPGYRYASILGSTRKLARSAGSDAVVTVAGLDRLRLSPISTALYVLVRHELGAQMPGSDVEHEQAIRFLEGVDIADAASMLDGVDKGTFLLPPGFDSGSALLEDQAAYAALVAERNDEGLTLYPYFVDAPSIPIVSASIGRNVLMAGALPRGDHPLSLPAILVLTALPGGYDINATTSKYKPSYARAVSNGDLLLVPQSDTSYDTFPYRQIDPNQPSPQVRQTRNVVDTTFRRYFKGDRYSLWVEVRRERAIYPDYPDYPPDIESITAFWVGSELQSARYFPSQLIGDRALPVFCPGYELTACEYAVHRFSAAGAGRTEDVGPKVDSEMLPIRAGGGEDFSWRSATRSSLQISYPQADVDYWQLDSGNGTSGLLVYVARDRAGDPMTLSGSTRMLAADTTDGFAGISPAGSWRYGTFEQMPLGYTDELSPYRYSTTFLRNADGTGVQAQRYVETDSSIYNRDYRFAWQVSDGRLYDTRYIADAPTGIAGVSNFSSCAQAQAAGATRCAPGRVRYFRPLSRVGNRLYGIEEIYDNAYAPPSDVVRFSRPNYYERQ